MKKIDLHEPKLGLIKNQIKTEMSKGGGRSASTDIKA